MTIPTIIKRSNDRTSISVYGATDLEREGARTCFSKLPAGSVSSWKML